LQRPPLPNCGPDLVELVNFAPGLIADRSGDVDFELQNRHELIIIFDFQFSIAD